ncbi:MAG: N-acetyltransferase [Deltaproteobacteria bacterium]|nr:N-acetyltransferase [Deltaproteobacteria bacterium]
MIRKASINDVRSMHGILTHYAAKGLLLGRSLSDLYAQLRDFIIVEDDVTHELVGTCSLRICWEDIAEIRSLAVREDYHGKYLGRKMVETCIREARDLGLKKLFVLTYVPPFFEKLGFSPVDKSVLPHKVWGDCIKCVKFPDCDEEALILEL